MHANIYEYIAAKGATMGIPPSPFGPFGKHPKKSGPDATNATRMGRVGGMGQGGGKMMIALQQGRGFLNQNR
jgi:hypothetical protein